MTTPISEATLVVIARTWHPSREETAESLRLHLSEADIASYRELENLFYFVDKGWGSLEDTRNMGKAFESPLYSDDCKKYFAAAHLRNELIFSFADRFLTEGIIVSYITSPAAEDFNLPYFSALMRGEHLSERIILAVLSKADYRESYQVLKTIPDWLITSGVIKTWMTFTARGSTFDAWNADYRALAIRKIKRSNPEYEGFPDEWVLRVFCGS